MGREVKTRVLRYIEIIAREIRTLPGQVAPAETRLAPEYNHMLFLPSVSGSSPDSLIEINAPLFPMKQDNHDPVTYVMTKTRSVTDPATQGLNRNSRQTHHSTHHQEGNPDGHD
jgi:hypothetical protein